MAPIRVAVRFGSRKLKTDTAISASLIVPVQIRRSVICRHQQIQIAVAIEIAIGKPSAHDRSVKTAADFPSNIAKFSSALIQKKLRRLRIAHIPANIPHRLVDVPISHRQIQPAV